MRNVLWIIVCLESGCFAPSTREQMQEIADLADSRSVRIADWEPFLLRSKEPAVRAATARAIGRVRDKDLSLLVRRCLALEEEDAVRAEMVFAIGQMEDSRAVEEILKEVNHVNPDLRAAAVEALGKLGDSSVAAELIGRLQDSAPQVRAAALLALARLRGRRAAPKEPLEPLQESTLIERAGALLEDPEPEVQWRAAYLLAEVDLEGRELDLRRGLESSHPFVRFFCLRGLLRLTGEKGPRPADVVPRVEDSDVHVAATAASGLSKVGTGNEVSVLVQALQRHSSGAHHVRAGACAGLAGIAARLEPEDASRASTIVALESALEDSSALVRTSAIQSLAKTDWTRAGAAFPSLLASADAFDRVAVAKACASVPKAEAEPILRGLLADPDPMVRVAALETAGTFAAEKDLVRGMALEAIADGDFTVQSTALVLLREHGTREDAGLAIVSYRRFPGHELYEGRMEAAKTAIKLDIDRAVVEIADSIADPSPSVAAAAREAFGGRLAEVRARVKPGAPARSSARARAGRDFFKAGTNPRALLSTARGEIEIELLPEQAPGHVKSFLELARDGIFDDTTMHRVVTGFVVQGLDPRGDGFGTGGAFLRDEINPMLYQRGSVGMPNAGKDSGGCQIFITHVPTPHLDGRHTIFARVVRGMETVDAIDLGDTVSRVQVLSADEKTGGGR